MTPSFRDSCGSLAAIFPDDVVCFMHESEEWPGQFYVMVPGRRYFDPELPPITEPRLYQKKAAEAFVGGPVKMKWQEGSEIVRFWPK